MQYALLYFNVLTFLQFMSMIGKEL